MWAEINKNLSRKPVNGAFKQEDNFAIMGNYGHEYISG